MEQYSLPILLASLLCHLLVSGLTLPEDYSERHKAITRFVNINKLAALLMRRQLSFTADFDAFAIYTMRPALETPIGQDETQAPDAEIPAAAAWISVLGREMYSWDREFPHGDREGDPGRGGPLWRGQHGPCKERWQLWRRRFGELSRADELSDELRKIAKDAEAQMADIEAHP